jgi:Protein of unknown function (DUF3306)
MAEEDNFFSRWSRRKVQAKEGIALPEDPRPNPLPKGEREQELPVPAECPASVAPLAGRGIEGEGPVAEEAPPLPTLADVAALTRDSDYKRFVVPGVDEGVKRAAMKKMFFSDPHFNVMDGLDTYIGDYNTPDPIPASMLRQMWQSKALGLFDDEEEAEKAPQLATAAQASPDGAPPAPLSQSPTEPAVPLDENPDLRLQPHDDPGRPGPDEGAGPERG